MKLFSPQVTTSFSKRLMVVYKQLKMPHCKSIAKKFVEIEFPKYHLWWKCLCLDKKLNLENVWWLMAVANLIIYKELHFCPPFLSATSALSWKFKLEDRLKCSYLTKLTMLHLQASWLVVSPAISFSGFHVNFLLIIDINIMMKS